MDQELIKTLAGQGVFAGLFGYLGHRQLKASDRLQEQNDKMVAQLIELNRLAIERDRATMDLMQKTIGVLDKISARIEK